VYFGLGLRGGVARETSALWSARLGLRPSGPTGLTITLDGAYGRAAEVEEWHAVAGIGYQLGLQKGPWTAVVGANLGGGALGQKAKGASSRWSGTFSLVPGLGLGYRLNDWMALAVEADGQLLVYRRDSSTVASFLPGAHLGLAVQR